MSTKNLSFLHFFLNLLAIFLPFPIPPDVEGHLFYSIKLPPGDSKGVKISGTYIYLSIKLAMVSSTFCGDAAPILLRKSCTCWKSRGLLRSSNFR